MQELFCLFCGAQQTALEIPKGGTFEAIGYLNCSFCGADIKFFVESWPN
jgi:transcription elongation factor Elf1